MKGGVWLFYFYHDIKNKVAEIFASFIMFLFGTGFAFKFAIRKVVYSQQLRVGAT